MTFLALLILGALWAAVLLPPMIQRLQTIGTSRPKSATAGGFTQNLARLERTDNKPVGGHYGYAVSPQGQQGESLLPDSALAAARRRRDVLGSLVALALFMLVATTMFGRIALYAHIVIDVAVVGFGALMIRRNRLAAQRAEVVTQLPTADPALLEELAFDEDSTVIDLSAARQFRKTS